MTRSEWRAQAIAQIDGWMDEASLKFHSGMLAAVAEGRLTLEAALDAIDAATEQDGVARREALDWPIARWTNSRSDLRAAYCAPADGVGARLNSTLGLSGKHAEQCQDRDQRSDSASEPIGGRLSHRGIVEAL